ncbi:MAG: glycosyl transferase family 9 [Bacteroidetes bacterium]|jgi:ADP-heptose:LPS heptosyltransferase|nr:glycosyl transferase family 9 [Bacteroidota bacterium]
MAARKKALIFFSAGVGDALLLVPLVNKLKKQEYHVTGLFTSPYHCESIFENTELFDAVAIKKNKIELVFFSLLHFRTFDLVFLNHFSYSKSHLSLAAFLGRDVYCNFSEYSSLQSSKAIHFIEPKPDTHDALQNLFLYNQNKTLSDLNFNLNYKPQGKNSFNLPKKYITIQVSSANNKAPYKNWPLENWLELFTHIQKVSPDISLVVLGDETELHLNEKLNTFKSQNVISLIGKTSLNEVVEVIHNSEFYIGLDSGLMHMAVALNKPTFTIWGASNPKLYGYEWMGNKHKVISLYLACAPCSAWINPNTSRVTEPLLCPDFKCIKELASEKVTKAFDEFLKAISTPLPSDNAGSGPII